jgi:hypothetical protein
VTTNESYNLLFGIKNTIIVADVRGICQDTANFEPIDCFFSKGCPAVSPGTFPKAERHIVDSITEFHESYDLMGVP